jgi:hypothetical protein
MRLETLGRGDIWAIDAYDECPLSVEEIEAKILDEESISLGGHYADMGMAMTLIEQQDYELTIMLARGEIDPARYGERKRDIALLALKSVARDFQKKL